MLISLTPTLFDFYAQQGDAQIEEEDQDEDDEEEEGEEEEATFLRTPLACFDLTYYTKFVRLPFRYRETYKYIHAYV